MKSNNVERKPTFFDEAASNTSFDMGFGLDKDDLLQQAPAGFDQHDQGTGTNGDTGLGKRPQYER